MSLNHLRFGGLFFRTVGLPCYCYAHFIDEATEAQGHRTCNWRSMCLSPGLPGSNTCVCLRIRAASFQLSALRRSLSSLLSPLPASLRGFSGSSSCRTSHQLAARLSCSEASCRWVKQAPEHQLTVFLPAPSPGSPGWLSVTAVPPLNRASAHPLQVPTFLCKEPLTSHSALLSWPPPAAGLNFRACAWRHLGSVLISWLGFLIGRGLRGGGLVR